MKHFRQEDEMTNGTKKAADRMSKKEWTAATTADALDRILDSMSKGTLPAWSIVRFEMPEGVEVPCQKYSMLNRLLVASAGGFDVRGFKTWNKVGRHVKKGGKSIRIFAPVFAKRKTTEEVNGKTEDVEKKFLIGFRLIPVFDVTATEGDDLNYELPEVPNIPFVDIASEFDLHVTAGFTDHGEGGWINNSTGEIRMCSPEARVFFHELGHALHFRQLEAEGKTVVAGQDEEQEIVADLTAGVLCNLTGQGWDPDSIATYIKGYKGDAKRVTRLFKVVEKSVDILMTVVGKIEK